MLDADALFDEANVFLMNIVRALVVMEGEAARALTQNFEYRHEGYLNDKGLCQLCQSIRPRERVYYRHYNRFLLKCSASLGCQFCRLLFPYREVYLKDLEDLEDWKTSYKRFVDSRYDDDITDIHIDLEANTLIYAQNGVKRTFEMFIQEGLINASDYRAIAD